MEGIPEGLAAVILTGSALRTLAPSSVVVIEGFIFILFDQFARLWNNSCILFREKMSRVRPEIQKKRSIPLENVSW